MALTSKAVLRPSSPVAVSRRSTGMPPARLADRSRMRHKTDMGEGQPVLRSKDPAGVMQEMWALFAACTHARRR
jgi:hypothetical protein